MSTSLGAQQGQGYQPCLNRLLGYCGIDYNAGRLDTAENSKFSLVSIKVRSYCAAAFVILSYFLALGLRLRIEHSSREANHAIRASFKLRGRPFTARPSSISVFIFQTVALD